MRSVPSVTRRLSVSPNSQEPEISRSADIPPLPKEKQQTKSYTTMGSLKKRRKAKINKHKRSKRMRQNRHKKRLRYKS